MFNFCPYPAVLTYQPSQVFRHFLKREGHLDW